MYCSYRVYTLIATSTIKSKFCLSSIVIQLHKIAHFNTHLERVNRIYFTFSVFLQSFNGICDYTLQKMLVFFSTMPNNYLYVTEHVVSIYNRKILSIRNILVCMSGRERERKVRTQVLLFLFKWYSLLTFCCFMCFLSLLMDWCDGVCVCVWKFRFCFWFYDLFVVLFFRFILDI